MSATAENDAWVCPECGGQIDRYWPHWVDRATGQRHHDPCPDTRLMPPGQTRASA